MADVERLCSRLLIIDHGRVLYDGSLDQIRDHGADNAGVDEHTGEPTRATGVRGTDFE